MVFGIDASRAEKGQHTGVEWYSINIIKALIPLVPASWDVVLYSRGGDLSTLGVLPKNWRIQVIKAPLNRGWTMFALSFIFFFRKPDIFFEPSHVTPMFAPQKTIAVVHDTAWKKYPRAYSWYGRIFLNYSLMQAKRAAKILTPTTFVKKELITLGIPSEKITAVWHGLDHAAYRQYAQEEIAPTLARHGLEKPYVLCVGRIEEKKNIGRLLDAWDAGGFAKDYDLVLIGKSGYGGEALIARAKTMSGVRILGWVSEADLPHLYAGARTLAYPTLYEGFGFPALQAAACGVPVVASRIGALMEIMGEAKNALWVENTDVSSITHGLTTILSDAGLRQEIATTAVLHAQDFTWERAGRETWRAIEALV